MNVWVIEANVVALKSSFKLEWYAEFHSGVTAEFHSGVAAPYLLQLKFPPSKYYT